MAYPSDGGTTVANCTDGTKTWTQIDTELHNAGYPGPFDHGTAEITAYQNAAHCTPVISGYNDTPGTPGTTPGTTPAKPTSLSAFVIAHPVESLVGGVLAGVLLSKMLG